MRIGALLILCLSLGALASSHEAAAADGFQWKPAEKDHIDLEYNGKPALRYMMPKLDESSPEKRNETFKPYHHVFSPDGQTLLTKGPGGLYPHHRGIFYGFNKITYGDGKQCDTWHCTGKAYQSHDSVLSAEDDAKLGNRDRVYADHTVSINWHGQEGELFAHEVRKISVTRPQQGEIEGWLVDFASTLKSSGGKPIRLDGDPQHAGVQFRASQEVPDKTAKETYYLRTDGKGEPGDYRNWDPKNPDEAKNAECENRPWNALSMVIGGQRYTVVYLDHPDNPKPARSSERDYGRFGSYFVADVTKEKPLKVEYRLWIQSGEMTVEQCNALHEDFVDEHSALNPEP